MKESSIASGRRLLRTAALAGAAAFALFALAACNGQNHMEASVAGGNAVAEGSTVTVTLPADDADHTWACASTDGVIELSDQASEDGGASDSEADAGSTAIFTFATSGQGSGTAVMEYSDAGGSTVETTATVTVETNSSGAITKLEAEES